MAPAPGASGRDPKHSSNCRALFARVEKPLAPPGLVGFALGHTHAVNRPYFGLLGRVTPSNAICSCPSVELRVDGLVAQLHVEQRLQTSRNSENGQSPQKRSWGSGGGKDFSALGPQGARRIVKRNLDIHQKTRELHFLSS